MADDQTVDAKEVVESLKSHTTKLRASKFVFAVSMPPEAQAAWTAAIERNDEPTVRRMSEEIHERARERRNHEAVALHQRRLRAQYVDINPNDGRWSRPSEVSMADASTLIRSVMAEIANALVASQSSDWIHAAFVRAGESRPEMGPVTHRVFACLAQGDAH